MTIRTCIVLLSKIMGQTFTRFIDSGWVGRCERDLIVVRSGMLFTCTVSFHV